MRTNLDFKPAYSASRQQSEEQTLDFICPIPSATPTTARHGALDGFVPSMSLSGSTYVTRVTALRDRHLVEGSCEVGYTLEAEFLRSETNQVVRRISCPVDVSTSVTPLAVEVTSSNHPDHVEQIAKPQQRSLNVFLTSHSQPEVSVEMPKVLGCILSDSSRLATGCRRLTIPVLVNVALPSHARRKAQSLLETDSFKCSVQAQWYTRRRFTTGPCAVDSVVQSDRVSTQKFASTLPPLYRATSEGAKYTASMNLDLLLPESISTPSISTNLLNVSYTLNLSMKFEACGNEALNGPYCTDFSLPVTLRTVQPQSIISPRVFDPLLGFVEEEASCAPPPYVY